jgi:hypothetical protein
MKRPARERRRRAGVEYRSGEIPKPGREMMGKRWFVGLFAPISGRGYRTVCVREDGQSCLRMSGRTARKNIIGTAWDLLR